MYEDAAPKPTLKRPGEDEIQEIRDPNLRPVTDEEKIAFTKSIKEELKDFAMSNESRERFRMLFQILDVEMMNRKSFEILLSNRHLVFTAFLEDYPTLSLERFEGKTVEEFHAAFEEMRKRIVNAAVLATEHFNKSCALLERFEKLAEEGGDNVLDEQVLIIQELVALHKGVDKKLVNFTKT